MTLRRTWELTYSPAERNKNMAITTHGGKTDAANKPEPQGLLGPATCSAWWEWAKHNDVTVYRMMQQDRCQPLENIIVQLVREKEQCFKRILDLESIAPRKITLPDGKVMVWRCPDALIPDSTPNEKVQI